MLPQPVAPRIYVETTIPSFYFEVRTEPAMVARRGWTREWWGSANRSAELLTSVAVLDEVRRGAFAAKDECLSLLADLPLLTVDQAVFEIVEAYVRQRVMPANPVGDALHLALASFHRCDFLVTWNCKHIANANKFGHIRRVNSMLGLFNPALVTPLELLAGDGDEG
jgi:hypothetical protein